LVDLIVENVDEHSYQSPVEAQVDHVKFIDDLDLRLNFAVSENDNNSTRATSSRRPQSTATSLSKFNHILFERQSRKVHLKLTISQPNSPRTKTERYSKNKKVSAMTQNNSPEIRCVFSTVNRDEEHFDERSEKSVETLMNSPTPGMLAVSAVFDHSSQPSFADWSKQTSELIEIISTGNDRRMNKKKSNKLRLSRSKRACSA